MKCSNTESLFDDGVVGDGDALMVDLGESTLVNQVANGLQVGITPSDIRVNQTQHLDGGLVQLDENTIVHLSETEELQGLKQNYESNKHSHT